MYLFCIYLSIENLLLFFKVKTKFPLTDKPGIDYHLRYMSQKLRHKDYLGKDLDNYPAGL